MNVESLLKKIWTFINFVFIIFKFINFHRNLNKFPILFPILITIIQCDHSRIYNNNNNYKKNTNTLQRYETTKKEENNPKRSESLNR